MVGLFECSHGCYSNIRHTIAVKGRLKKNVGAEKLNNALKVTQILSSKARIYIPGRPTIESLNSGGFGFWES